MGIPLQIFSLYQLQSKPVNCHHYLLLRVEQAEFSNANQAEYDFVTQVADRKRTDLLAIYQSEVLADECPGFHEETLVGELQNTPIGNQLIEGHGGFYVDIWVAETRLGHPWIVLGLAGDEESFWQEIAQDEDLAQLGALKPAVKQHVFFLTEEDRLGS